MTVRSLLLSVVAVVSVSAAASDEPAEVLMQLDREVAGLLDSYLEAVPECPVREDTPVRLWLLDLAWLRASLAVERAQGISAWISGQGEEIELAWDSCLASIDDCLVLYEELRDFYRTPAWEAPELSMLLEDSLIYTDSVWMQCELDLFGLLNEKGLI